MVLGPEAILWAVVVISGVSCLSVLCSCVGIEEHQSTDIDNYHCPNCQPEHGPLTCKSLVCKMHGTYVLRVWEYAELKIMGGP